MRYQFLRFPGGKGKAVTFSYDDGVRQDLKFSDVLEKYKIKATFNLNAENLRGSNGLTKDEILKRMQAQFDYNDINNQEYLKTLPIFIIKNSGDLNHLKEQTQNAIQFLRN